MANMNLVTGYIGSNHVTAADAGSFNAAIFGDGQYLLNRGQKLAATVVTNNHLRISDGDLVMQGRHVRINEGNYVDLNIENGASDYNRNDLVVARYTKNANSGVEEVNLVVIKGTAATGTAEDPAYTIGDIMNDGAVLNDMPLYRIKLNGLNIAEVNLLAEEAHNFQGMAAGVDAAMLGGKPPEFYLTPRNLLNNSYFINPVNQREYSSGSVVKPWGYFIDRWINNSDQNATYTFSERGLGIRANNTITQKIPDISAGTVVSFSATDDNGNTIVISGTVAYNADGSWLQMAVDEENSSFGVMLATSGGFVQVIIAAKTNVTISVAALYGGVYTVSSLPPYYPNDYSFELENCKKYFEKVKCAGVLSKTDYSKNYVCAPVNFTEKRIVPTVIVESLWCPKYYSMEQLGTIDIRETDRKSVILSSATLTAEGCLFHATLHVSGDL